MSRPSPTRPPTPSAADIARQCDLGPDARALLRDGLGAAEYFQLLLDKELHTDAIRFAAHALARREAVWWGCLCVWLSGRPQPGEKAEAALRAAVRWVREPSEENRRAAETAARSAGAGTPAGSLALAAFWSGGSLSPSGLPEVPPEPALTAQAVAGAVLLAGAGLPRARRRDRYRQFLELGLQVSDGTLPSMRPRH